MARFRGRLRLKTAHADEYALVAAWLFDTFPNAPQEIITWFLGGPETELVGLLLAIDDTADDPATLRAVRADVVDNVDKVTPRKWVLLHDSREIVFERESETAPWTKVFDASSGDGPFAEIVDGRFSPPKWNVRFVEQTTEGLQLWAGTIEPATITGRIRVETTESSGGGTFASATARRKDRRLTIEFEDAEAPDIPLRKIDGKVVLRASATAIDVRAKATGRPTRMSIQFGAWAWAFLRFPVQWWGGARLAKQFAISEAEFRAKESWTHVVETASRHASRSNDL